MDRTGYAGYTSIFREGGAVPTSRVVLAYSGGLDTSVAIHWLRVRKGRVIAFAANLGQAGDLIGELLVRA